ncbi:Protein of unknown function [Solimonas aquatica]|uniref:DUF3015 domain-containing protein n=1 Tax=Solimonas aquatica TaxID=489703 RepID=A0A1H9KY11_9GAMM|nr:DUF3015 family protein [Solimonas aquatica]SER04072.1 Protein of unknown function [Solimonas aquatica]
MKKLLALAALTLAPLSAMADHDAGCGVGTHLMAGQTGVMSKLLATYTNGILGNGTFGISSGTLGCNGRDAVTEGAKFTFLSSNLDQLSTEAAIGSGESLSTLAGIYGITDAKDRALFYAMLKNNYTKIFDRADVSSNEIAERVEALMGADQHLARYIQA